MRLGNFTPRLLQDVPQLILLSSFVSRGLDEVLRAFLLFFELQVHSNKANCHWLVANVFPISHTLGAQHYNARLSNKGEPAGALIGCDDGANAHWSSRGSYR